MAKIKNANKNLFRNAKKETTEWMSVRKMMERFDQEMNREWAEEEKVIAWSMGNNKTHIPSYSTMPGFTCMTNGKYPPCFTSGQCYALYDLRNPVVIENAVHNTVLIVKYPKEFEASFLLGCMMHPAIRLHVEGDFVNANEVKIVNRCVAKTSTTVVTYTKKYEMLNTLLDNGEKLVDRLIILFSRWEGLEMDNKYGFPECHVYKTVEEYLNAKDARFCGSVIENTDNSYTFIKGNCSECFMHHVLKDGKGGCFDMKDTAMLAH